MTAEEIEELLFDLLIEATLVLMMLFWRPFAWMLATRPGTMVFNFVVNALIYSNWLPFSMTVVFVGIVLLQVHDIVAFALIDDDNLIITGALWFMLQFYLWPVALLLALRMWYRYYTTFVFFPGTTETRRFYLMVKHLIMVNFSKNNRSMMGAFYNSAFQKHYRPVFLGIFFGYIMLYNLDSLGVITDAIMCTTLDIPGEYVYWQGMEFYMDSFHSAHLLVVAMLIFVSMFLLVNMLLTYNNFRRLVLYISVAGQQTIRFTKYVLYYGLWDYVKAHYVSILWLFRYTLQMLLSVGYVFVLLELFVECDNLLLPVILNTLVILLITNLVLYLNIPIVSASSWLYSKVRPAHIDSTLPHVSTYNADPISVLSIANRVGSILLAAVLIISLFIISYADVVATWFYDTTTSQFFISQFQLLSGQSYYLYNFVSKSEQGILLNLENSFQYLINKLHPILTLEQYTRLNKVLVFIPLRVEYPRDAIFPAPINENLEENFRINVFPVPATTWKTLNWYTPNPAFLWSDIPYYKSFTKTVDEGLKVYSVDVLRLWGNMYCRMVEFFNTHPLYRLVGWLKNNAVMLRGTYAFDRFMGVHQSVKTHLLSINRELTSVRVNDRLFNSDFNQQLIKGAPYFGETLLQYKRLLDTALYNSEHNGILNKDRVFNEHLLPFVRHHLTGEVVSKRPYLFNDQFYMNPPHIVREFSPGKIFVSFGEWWDIKTMDFNYFLSFIKPRFILKIVATLLIFIIAAYVAKLLLIMCVSLTPATLFILGYIFIYCFYHSVWSVYNPVYLDDLQWMVEVYQEMNNFIHEESRMMIDSIDAISPYVVQGKDVADIMCPAEALPFGLRNPEFGYSYFFMNQFYKFHKTWEVFRYGDVPVFDRTFTKWSGLVIPQLSFLFTKARFSTEAYDVNFLKFDTARDVEPTLERLWKIPKLFTGYKFENLRDANGQFKTYNAQSVATAHLMDPKYGLSVDPKSWMYSGIKYVVDIPLKFLFHYYPISGFHVDAIYHKLTAGGRANPYIRHYNSFFDSIPVLMLKTGWLHCAQILFTDRYQYYLLTHLWEHSPRWGYMVPRTIKDYYLSEGLNAANLYVWDHYSQYNWKCGDQWEKYFMNMNPTTLNSSLNASVWFVPFVVYEGLRNLLSPIDMFGFLDNYMPSIMEKNYIVKPQIDIFPDPAIITYLMSKRVYSAHYHNYMDDIRMEGLTWTEPTPLVTNGRMFGKILWNKEYAYFHKDHPEYYYAKKKIYGRGMSMHFPYLAVVSNRHFGYFYKDLPWFPAWLPKLEGIDYHYAIADVDLRLFVYSICGFSTWEISLYCLCLLWNAIVYTIEVYLQVLGLSFNNFFGTSPFYNVAELLVNNYLYILGFLIVLSLLVTHLVREAFHNATLGYREFHRSGYLWHKWDRLAQLLLFSTSVVSIGFGTALGAFWPLLLLVIVGLLGIVNLSYFTATGQGEGVYFEDSQTKGNGWYN